MNGMISCTTCGRKIAQSADLCPSCGAKNTWVHPKILSFLSEKDSISPIAFNFEHTSSVLYCYREKQTISYARNFYKIGIVILLIGVILNFIATEIAIYVMGFSTLFVGLGLLTGGVNLMDGSGVNYIKFHFTENDFTIESDDTNKWIEINQYIGG